MRPHALLLLTLFSAGSTAACKHPGSAKLEGRWRGQRAAGVPAEAQASADAFAIGSEIVAKGNQITISTPAAKNVTATYFVDKEEPTGLVIHTDKDVSSETLVFVDPKTMTWKVDERRSIVFKKVE